MGWWWADDGFNDSSFSCLQLEESILKYLKVLNFQPCNGNLPSNYQITRTHWKEREREGGSDIGINTLKEKRGKKKVSPDQTFVQIFAVEAESAPPPKADREKERESPAHPWVTGPLTGKKKRSKNPSSPSLILPSLAAEKIPPLSSLTLQTCWECSAFTLTSHPICRSDTDVRDTDRTGAEKVKKTNNHLETDKNPLWICCESNPTKFSLLHNENVNVLNSTAVSFINMKLNDTKRHFFKER